MILALLMLVFLSTTVHAQDYSFSWELSEDNVEGYKLYYKNGGNAGPPYDGTGAAEGDSPILISNQSQFTISDLDFD